MSPPIVLTHGCSLSNLPLFVAAADGLFAAEGIEVDVQRYDTISATSDVLASGVAELGTAAFTQPLVDAAGPNPSRLVAGSGLMGIALLAQPEIHRVSELAGRTVGTFLADPLEVLLHDAVAAAGLQLADMTVQHFDRIAEAIDAWRAGELAAVTLAEPHATRLRAFGARELSDGRELWGDPFPDTVLVASERLLAEQPETVRAAIRAMLAAEAQIHSDLGSAVEMAGEHFPDFSLAELASAATRQPPCVDLRHLAPTVLARWAALQKLGHAPGGPAPTVAIQLELLEAELAARRPLPDLVSSTPKES